MAEAFWQGTAVGLLVGVLGSLAAFRAPLAVLSQIAKDHNARLVTVENITDRLARAGGVLKTRKTDTEGD